MFRWGWVLALLPAVAWADRVDVRLAVYHAEVHPVTGEACGGAFSGVGATNLNVFFDNVEMNARDEQVNWPERRFDQIPPGEGGWIDATLDWSPGNPILNVPAGLQSLYTVRIGWQDLDILATERDLALDAYRIEMPGNRWITRDGWTNRNPGNDFARIGVPVCNRPPAPIENGVIFPDREPGSVYLSWRHVGGLADAVDWSHAEIFLSAVPEIEGDPVYSQFAWGLTNHTITDLDCGTWYACYRNYDVYGHVTETCDGEVEVVDCAQEPDMAVPDMAVPDMAVPDMAVPDMAVPDMAVPDMAVPEPDMAAPEPDMAVVPPLPDMAVVPPLPDMAVAPDQGLADVGPGDPQPDAGSSPDASPGDPQPDAGAADLDAAPAVDAAVADAAVRDLGPGDPQPAFDFGVEADAFDLGPGDPQPRFDLGTVGDTKDAAPYDATPARAEAGPTGDTSGGATDSGCRATPTAAPLWLALLALGWRRRRA